jgi:hypothetical protein
MGAIRQAAVLAMAIGVAVTAGCGTASHQQTTVAADRAPAATATGTARTATPGTAASVTTASAAPSTNPEPVLTGTGLAGVRLGADAPAFATALGHELGALDATDRQMLADHRCVIRGLRGVEGLALMVIGADADGPVRVIGLHRGSRIRTSGGIGLGDSLDDVRRAYGGFLVDESFDFWPEDGHALTAQATDGARWVFIADNRNQVVEIRLGLNPEVYYPEGCA